MYVPPLKPPVSVLFWPPILALTLASENRGRVGGKYAQNKVELCGPLRDVPNVMGQIWNVPKDMGNIEPVTVRYGHCLVFLRDSAWILGGG